MRFWALALLFVACNDRPPPQTPVAAPAADPPPLANANQPVVVPSASASATPGCNAPAKSGAASQHVKVGGADRAYTVVVPDGYRPDNPYPLVFALHGSGGSAASARNATDLEKRANGGAIFVYPDAGREWDLNDPADRNADVAFFDTLLFTVANSLCFDRRRVFVTGFSNGAYMANQLGCRRGDRIRGVVTSAGGGPFELSGSYDAEGHLVCNGKAVAALVLHGSADGSVAPSEGQKSLDHWSFANKCTSGTSAGAIAPCTMLQGCVQPVGTCRIPGLGHAAWPRAGEATWSFVESLR